MRAKEYGDWWLTTVKGNIADSTCQEYEGYPVLGDKLFAKVTRPIIRDLMAEKRKKYEPATVRNMLAPVRAMYNQAIEDGEPIPMNPAARFGKKNKGKQKTIINQYSKEETSKFLQEALSKVVKDYPLYLCAIRSGMRQGAYSDPNRHPFRVQIGTRSDRNRHLFRRKSAHPV